MSRILCAIPCVKSWGRISNIDVSDWSVNSHKFTAAATRYQLRISYLLFSITNLISTVFVTKGFLRSWVKNKKNSAVKHLLTPRLSQLKISAVAHNLHTGKRFFLRSNSSKQTNKVLAGSFTELFIAPNFDQSVMLSSQPFMLIVFLEHLDSPLLAHVLLVFLLIMEIALKAKIYSS